MTKYFNKIASTLQTRYIKVALRHNVAMLINIDTVCKVVIAMLISKLQRELSCNVVCKVVNPGRPLPVAVPSTALKPYRLVTITVRQLSIYQSEVN